MEDDDVLLPMLWFSQALPILCTHATASSDVSYILWKWIKCKSYARTRAVSSSQAAELLQIALDGRVHVTISPPEAPCIHAQPLQQHLSPT